MHLKLIFLLFEFVIHVISAPAENDVKVPSSSLNTDFENGLGLWFDASAAGVRWSLESADDLLEPSPAPVPSRGSRYLRATRNPSNTFGTALLRSQPFTAEPGDEFSFSFWIRSKRLWSNNLMIYWYDGTQEQLLLELYPYSSMDNFEWRDISVAIPVTTTTETNIRIYGVCGDNEEDAIAIDNIVVGPPVSPESTTQRTTTSGGTTTFNPDGSTTTTTSQNATTGRTTTSAGPTIPNEVVCVPSGSLSASDAKCARYNGMCYCRYKPVGWSWPYANWYCKQLSMNLLSLESRSEEQWVTSFAGSGGFWMSGARASSSDEWIWSGTQQPFSYNNWGSPAEAQETGYNYIMSPSAYWYASDGITGALSFICEQPPFTYPTQAPPTRNPGQPGCPADEGYMTWYPGTTLNGKLYCFSSYWADWENADRYCKSVNLQLISLETEAESSLVNQYIDQQDYDIGGGFWTSGICDSASGSWKWTGSNLPFSFSNFNDTANSVCAGSVSGNYVWFSNDLDEKWFFNPKYYYRQVICEQP